MKSKKYLLTLLLLSFCFLILGSNTTTALAEQVDMDELAQSLEDANYADDKIMVVLTRSATEKGKNYTVQDFSEISCKSVTNIFSKDNNPRSFLKNDFKQVICIELNTGGEQQLLDAIEKLYARQDVELAEPDYQLTPCSTTPNDEDYVDQWGLSKINAPGAWDITTGSSTVKVGVIDTGIDGTHPDLAGNISSTLNAHFPGYEPTYGVSPSDSSGHGTKVAGVIGAVGNNSIGVSGVCWDVELVSLDCEDNPTETNLSDFGNAISYADREDVQIPILNMSYGIYANTNPPSLQTCINNYYGLVICSAGNDNVDIDQYSYWPATHTCNNIITVGASTVSDEKKDDSNYGAVSVDLFAPGVNINTTVNGGGYGIGGATSLATPFVTGVAALLLSKYPCMTPAEIKASILNNVDEIDALDGLCVTGGRLNAGAALSNPTVAHNYQYQNLNVSQHVGTCICGQTTTTAHTLTYSNVTTTTHKQTCNLCQYSATVEHLLLITSKTLTGHVRTCKCGHTVDEQHTWVQTTLGYTCSVCRYTSSFIPGIMNSLSYANRLKLEQANLKQGQVNWIDGLPIIYFDGEYYLLKIADTQATIPISPQLME